MLHGSKRYLAQQLDLKIHQEVHFPSPIIVWLRLPHLLLHCWNKKSLEFIGNSLGKYIDKYKPLTYMFTYIRIYIEIQLEKFLLKSINLSLLNQTHLHIINYDKIPFRFKIYNEYCHFSKYYLSQIISKPLLKILISGSKLRKNQLNIIGPGKGHKKDAQPRKMRRAPDRSKGRVRRTKRAREGRTEKCTANER